jgi:hypothetical protein
MFCQLCGAFNPDEQEYCSRCHQKLLVLSGIASPPGEDAAETVRHLLATIHKQERSILINQSGLATMRELLEDRRLLGSEEWSELWQSKVDYQMLALEKRER